MFLPLIKDVYIFIPRKYMLCCTISSLHMFSHVVYPYVYSLITRTHVWRVHISHKTHTHTYAYPLFITTKPYYLRFGKMKVWWNYTYLNVSKEPTKEWGILISTIIYLIFFQYETHKFTIRMPLIVCLIWTVYKKKIEKYKRNNIKIT